MISWFLHLLGYESLQQQSKEANDYLSLIQDQMPFAVEQCIEAAGHEYEPPQQKELLKVREHNSRVFRLKITSGWLPFIFFGVF